MYIRGTNLLRLDLQEHIYIHNSFLMFQKIILQKKIQGSTKTVNVLYYLAIHTVHI